MDRSVDPPSPKPQRSPRKSSQSPHTPGSRKKGHHHRRKRHHRQHGADGERSPPSYTSPPSPTTPITSSVVVSSDPVSTSIPFDEHVPHPFGFSGRTYPQSPYPETALSHAGSAATADVTKENYETPLFKYVVIAMAVVFVLSIVAAMLYARQPGVKRPAAHTAGECMTTPCLEYKERFRYAMDRGENPCKNFYKHVCGAWIDVQDPGVTVAGTFWTDFITQATSRLESLDATKEQQEPIQKAAVYLQACLGVLRKSNVAGVKKVLSEVGITWPERNPKPDFLNTVFFMSTHTNFPVLFQPGFIQMNSSDHDISILRWDRFCSTMATLRTIFQMGRLVDHIRITYESFGGSRETDRLRELTVQLKNFTEFFSKYGKVFRKEVSNKNVSAFFQLTPSIQKERWDSVYQKHLGVTVSGAHGVTIEDVDYVAAVFELHKRHGEAFMNDIVESLCIQNLVGFTEARILESFHGNAESAESAVRAACLSITYSAFGYAMNNLFLRSKSVPYEEVVHFAKNISREIPSLFRRNSSLVERSKPRKNFEQLFRILEMSQPGSYPRSYERYPDMTDNPLENLINIMNSVKKHHNEDADPFLNYDYEGAHYEGFELTIPYISSPVYSADAHWAIRYGGIGARIAAAVFLDYVEGSDNAREIYQKNQDCLSNKSGKEVDVNLQAAVASASVVPALYQRERATANEYDPLFMNILPFRSDQIPFAFGCYLMCGQYWAEEMCNTPLKHSVNFARAFSCTEGSPMNPKSKCWMFPA
ncbi:hypothetical protein HPB50_018452 [Hyalomma asiaticum]|uniref:Uncharacterized protein n=1 Tax=Hyalomma asiaticum TaxID=266040 RepID=A0ACB7SNS2_HYAAI|nr:hypothetical protein HPB50_018452 [Hyalomma asiaticum]